MELLGVVRWGKDYDEAVKVMVEPVVLQVKLVWWGRLVIPVETVLTVEV